jgi:hypothetical protein
MQLLEEISARQQKDQDELMKTSPELALQKKLNDEQWHAQFVSNMMNMMHQTSMTIIGNMR